jgi:hypothetical protein
MLFLKKAYWRRTLQRNALRKGLLGGSPLWRAVWFAQLAHKGWGKISKSGEAPITFTESIEEGEAWAIVHEPEQSKRGRGEGRALLVGPKRKPPLANVMTGSALGNVGRRILEAPSADRINQILGADIVEQPPASRYQRRQAKKAQARVEKQAANEAKAAARQADADAKAAAKQADADAKAAAKQAKADEKLARKAKNAEER